MALTPEEQQELDQLNKMASYPGPISVSTTRYAPQNQETSLLKYAQGEGLNKNELTAFMAQVSHESNGFRNLEEIGGGKDSYGGGKGYKGRGYIQLTHDYNYKAMGDKLGIDLLNNPDLAADPEIAKRIAVQWWKDNVRPGVKDWNDVYSHSRLVNYPNATGPEQVKGYDERVAEFQKYQKQLRLVVVEVKGGLFKIPAIQVPEVLSDWPEARVVPSSTSVAFEKKRQ
jgi:putative chitinase